MSSVPGVRQVGGGVSYVPPMDRYQPVTPPGSPPTSPSCVTPQLIPAPRPPLPARTPGAPYPVNFGVGGNFGVPAEMPHVHAGPQVAGAGGGGAPSPGVGYGGEEPYAALETPGSRPAFSAGELMSPPASMSGAHLPSAGRRGSMTSTPSSPPTGQRHSTDRDGAGGGWRSNAMRRIDPSLSGKAVNLQTDAGVQVLNLVSPLQMDQARQRQGASGGQGSGQRAAEGYGFVMM